MKNLIDELHELDNYEYKVSKDFSKRVMKNIKKEKNKNKFNYAISIASIGIVACFAVVLFNNSDFKSSIFDFSKGVTESNNMESSAINNNAYYDSIENISDEADNVFLDDNKNNYFTPESNSGIVDSFVNDFDSYETDKYISESDVAEQKGAAGQLAENILEEKQESTNNTPKNATLREENDYKEIEKILKNADLSIEVTEDEIKVKSTKDKIEDLLKGYDNLDIKTEEEYVVIKFK